MTRKRKKPQNNQYVFFRAMSDCCEWINNCLHVSKKNPPMQQTPNASQQFFGETDTSNMSPEELRTWQMQVLDLFALERKKELELEAAQLLSKAKHAEEKGLEKIKEKLLKIRVQLNALGHNCSFDEIESASDEYSYDESDEEEHDLEVLVRHRR